MAWLPGVASLPARHKAWWNDHHAARSDAIDSRNLAQHRVDRCFKEVMSLNRFAAMLGLARFRRQCESQVPHEGCESLVSRKPESAAPRGQNSGEKLDMSGEGQIAYDVFDVERSEFLGLIYDRLRRRAKRPCRDRKFRGFTAGAHGPEHAQAPIFKRNADAQQRDRLNRH